jgi:hypothetical protein
MSEMKLDGVGVNVGHYENLLSEIDKKSCGSPSIITQ